MTSVGARRPPRGPSVARPVLARPSREAHARVGRRGLRPLTCASRIHWSAARPARPRNGAWLPMVSFVESCGGRYRARWRRRAGARGPCDRYRRFV